MSKYDHINFKPPASVAKAAERGLSLRQEQEGDKAGLTQEEASEQGIGSGVQRAVNLKNRDALSPSTIQDMVGFFARFRKLISKARKLSKKEEQLESNMYISDLLWGGAPGEAWAQGIAEKMEKADQERKAACQLRAAELRRLYVQMQASGLCDTSVALRVARLARRLHSISD
jgi:hypothetical protein